MANDISKIVRQRKRRKSKSDIMKRRLLAAALAACAIGLAFGFVRLGYVRFVRQEALTRAENQTNRKLKAKTESLRSEIARLRTIEGKKELARTAGLVDKGEVPIIINDSKEDARKKQAPDGGK